MDETLGNVMHELKSENISVGESDVRYSPAILRKNVCFIVAAVIMRDDTVLMIREARADCYGLWYLPAGKVEPNETILNAAVREVLEETGLRASLRSLITVENAMGGFWFRFTFAGDITGGDLKDSSKKDKESLEAAWIPVVDILNKSVKLRAYDAVKLIELGQAWYKSSKNQSKFYTLPVKVSHRTCKLRIFLIHKNEDNVELFITKRQDMTFSLPEAVVDTSSSRVGMETLLRSNLLQAGFYGTVNICGVVSIEHCPSVVSPTDGVCLNILCEVASQSERCALENKGKFHNISQVGSWLAEVAKLKAYVDLLYH